MTKNQQILYDKMVEVCDKLDRQHEENRELTVLLRAIPNTIIRQLDRLAGEREEEDVINDDNP